MSSTCREMLEHKHCTIISSSCFLIDKVVGYAVESYADILHETRCLVIASVDDLSSQRMSTGPKLKFCPESNDLLYPVEDRERRKLVYQCRNCGYREDAHPSSYCVYRCAGNTTIDDYLLKH